MAHIRASLYLSSNSNDDNDDDDDDDNDVTMKT